MQFIDRASEEIAPLIQTIREHADELLLVLLGLGGVLAEYAEDPAAVRLSPARGELLRRLMTRPGVALGVVSGRRVHDLRPRVGLGDDVFYIALHGLEVVGPGFTRVEHQAFEQYPQRLRDIVAEITPLMSKIKGAHLEDKEAALALHTREASGSDAVWARLRLLSRAAEIADPRSFRVLRGNHVFELLPNVGPARAAAVSAIRDLLERREGRRVFALYVGEDVAEDDAYEAIAGRGVTAVVGRRAAHADHHLESIEMVDQLLVQLAAARDPGETDHRS